MITDPGIAGLKNRCFGISVHTGKILLKIQAIFKGNIRKVTVDKPWEIIYYHIKHMFDYSKGGTMAASNKNNSNINNRPLDISEKKKALDAAISKIEKDYGKGSVMKLGDKTAMDVDTISTGSISLDKALGVGGVPRGRIIEIFGPEASGKTTLALHIVAEVQKAGGIAGFIDAEHALDPKYAKDIGVDVDNLYISQPDYGEQGLEICETMVRSGAIDIIVVDSVAALVPKHEIEGEMGDATVGAQARLMSQALRKLTAVANKTGCSIIFINQLREKIGVFYGPSETTTGGRALKFYASVRIDIRRIESLKQAGDVIGNRVRAKVVKNKVAPPFREAEFDIIFGEGISVVGDILDQAVEYNIIGKSGAWYSYNGEKIGQGRENTKAWLKDNPEFFAQIQSMVRSKLGFPGEEGEVPDLPAGSGVQGASSAADPVDDVLASYGLADSNPDDLDLD